MTTAWLCPKTSGIIGKDVKTPWNLVSDILTTPLNGVAPLKQFFQRRVSRDDRDAERDDRETGRRADRDGERDDKDAGSCRHRKIGIDFGLL